MTFHQVAVVVLAGWYLLAPPLTADLKLDSDQPLTKWNHLGSYDSAKECEMYRMKLYQAALNSKSMSNSEP